MKKHLLTFTIAFLVFTGGKMFAQCNAGFTWSQSQPNVIDFVNTSAPQNPGSQYWWSYGDTLGDYGPGPFQHLYYVPGVYYACLSVYDSISQTQCFYCDTVTVTGTVLCNMPITMVGGVASHPAAADGACGVTNVVGGVWPYTYLWNTGATTDWITGLTTGTYWCCVTDAAGCTTCDTVTVTSNDSTSCNVGSYFYTFQGSSWMNALGSAMGGHSNSYSLQWDFGDLTTGSGDDVWHQYALPGTYAVCITLIDSLTGCTATACDSITISFGQANCVASFVVQPDTGNPNQTWIFNVSMGSPSMTYLWEWGDQTPNSTGPFPTHVYQNSGSYWILLVVTDPVTQCVDSMYQMLWVARLTQEASLAPHYVNVVAPVGMEDSENQITWRLFPNPANNILNVQGSVNNNEAYIITDVSGRTVQAGTLTNNSVDVSALPGGFFFFTLVKENGVTESKRFIRE